MRRLNVILPVVIVLAGAMGAVLLIRSRPEVETKPRSVAPPVVRVQVVVEQDHRYTVMTQGTVEPRTEIALTAEVTGRVLDVSPALAVGGFFEKGDVLAGIDPRDYELAAEQARATLRQAEVRVAREEAEAEVARREWERLGSGDASPLALREPQLTEARAALDAVRAALEQAERDLGRTRVRAPFACLVRQKSVDLGQFVSRGAPVAQIYAVDYAEVRLPVTGDDLAALDIAMGAQRERAEGPRVTLRASFAGEEQSWEGRIVRTEGVIDPRSRMVTLVARVEDPYGRNGGRVERQDDSLGDGLEQSRDGAPLAVGLFVDAEIEGRAATGVVVLPRAALRDRDRVLVVDPDNRLRFRDVEVLRTEGETAFIGTGLSAGERVCLTHMETVIDGMRVRIEGEEPEAGSEGGPA